MAERPRAGSHGPAFYIQSSLGQEWLSFLGLWSVFYDSGNNRDYDLVLLLWFLETGSRVTQAALEHPLW